MTLNAGQANHSYWIEHLDLPPALGQRLEAIGMTKGSAVHVVSNKNRGTMIVKIRGARFAIGRGVTENVHTRHLADGA